MVLFVDSTTSLQTIKCWVCAIWFAVDSVWLEERKKDGRGFSCPNKCNIAWGPSEVEKLKKEVTRLQASEDRLSAENKHAWELAEKNGKKFERLRRRVDAGVCPHCNRTFQNLADHVKTKHKKTAP